MIRKYYIAFDPPGAAAPDPSATGTPPPGAPATPGLPGGPPAGGGGGSPPAAPAAPKGYTVTTPQERSDWNGFLDYASKQGANISDPKQRATLMGQYKKANPNFSITAEQIPNIQYEAYQLRKGDSFGNLGAKELGYIRQGMNPNYLNTDTGNIGKLYYPREGSYGTDLENYYNSKFNPAAAKPPAIAMPSPSPANGSVSSKPSASPPGAIPRPDYNDQQSRLDYAKAFTKKYGPLMESRGDTPLRINETPPHASDSIKNISTQAANKLGIDPALLYSSAMEEGMSGIFPKSDKTFDYSGDKQYPVFGSHSFGLDTFVSKYPDLVKKGYLPAGMDFKQYVPPPDKNWTKDSANFKSVEDAMAAKAAFLKDNYDDIDAYAKDKGIVLSPKARDFFALANYNGGKGLGHGMLDDYSRNGYLKNDKFLEARPTKGQGLKDTSYGPLHDENGNVTDEGAYTHIIRRLKMADALKQEKLF